MLKETHQQEKAAFGVLEKAGKDEKAAFGLLEKAGLASAGIIKYLLLTRGVVSEAYQFLRHGREAQTNLAHILGAARLKIQHGGRIYHTKCPKTFCHAWGSFPDILEWYHSLGRVERGAAVVPF